MQGELRPLTFSNLVWLRAFEDAEGFNRLTCRPVRSRSEAERKALYQSYLDDDKTTIRGLWLPCDPNPIGKFTATDYNPRNGTVEVGYFLRP